MKKIFPTVLMLAVVGCGRSGPERFDLSGTVTVNGKRAEIGRILFVPDASQGNAGPGTAGRIMDGHYTTPADLGHTGGPHRAFITVWQKPPSEPKPNEAPGMGSMLCVDHEISVQLPAKSGTVDLDVRIPAAGSPK